MQIITKDVDKKLKKIKKRIKAIRPEIWLIIVVIFALALRMNFFLGLNLNDDLCYLEAGYRVNQGYYTLTEWIVSPRIMMYFPIAFFYTLFGVSDFTGALYILLCSLSSVAVAYFIGKTLFSPGVGLASAFLMAIFPMEVLFGTTLVPDVPVAFFMGLSVCLFLIGEKSDNKIYYLFAGIAIGLAWLVKSLSILIILFYISYFLFDKIFDFKFAISGIKKKSVSKIKKIFSIRKGFILTALGFLLVLFFEGLIYLRLYDNLFYRFKIETQHYTSTLKGCIGDLDYYPSMLLAKNPPEFNFFGLFFIFFCLCIFLFLIFDRNKKILIFIIWFVALFLWIQYGTMNPSEYALMHRLHRFLTVLTLPIAVTIGYFIAGCKINKKRVFNAVNIIIVCVLIITSFYTISAGHFVMDQAIIDFRETADFFRDYPDKDIYTDFDTRGKLNFYLGYERIDDLKSLEEVENISDIKDAFVAINVSRGFVENKCFSGTLPDFVYNPPDDWQIAKIITAAYSGSYANFNPIIYYVPP